ncbi:unnamed protein product [Caenorhabditis bovis]|uniref:CN hydrolase domain-containing protein n=1 Tax=Caenorhabditis bovis TaxID=2654633 RepID=A0A8S1EZV1_9PELO|nr:unnamed protein product [Caenorhabditis bovis]
MPKIAIVQAGTVLYDTPATIRKLEKFVNEAANNNVDLVLFPEAFVGGYPKWNSFGITLGTRTMEGREEYLKYFNNAIEENGPECQQIEELAKNKNIHIVVGVIEKLGTTLYCSAFFFSPNGYIGKHRKLLPTALERCIWGQGDGSDVKVFETSFGNISATICWENYMPLLRFSLYSKGVQIYLAPTVDDREVWLPTMRTIALEGRCFVVSACQFLKSSAYPEEHYLRKEHGDDKVLIRGGSCAVDPLGNVLVEPDFTQEIIRYVEFDTSTITLGKMDLDVTGHYSRPDVFQLHVNDQSNSNVKFSSEK